MIVRSVKIEESLTLSPIPTEEIVEAYQGGQAKIWVDFRDPVEAELEVWLDALGVRGLARRLCLNARDRPGVYPLNTEVFFVIPVQSESAARENTEYVSFLCNENLLLTVHREILLDADRRAALDSTEAWLPEASVAGLVSALVISQSLEDLGRTTVLRDSVLALEKRMDEDPDRVEAEEILDLRAELVAFSALVTDQIPALRALTQLDKPFFRLSGSQEYFNCARTNVQAVMGSVSLLDERVRALRSGFEMHAQDKTNRRLGALTVLSAVFMPVSLLAGIWGMNFKSMPELSLPYAYPIGLGLMVLLGFGMFRFFRKTGWFG